MFKKKFKLPSLVTVLQKNYSRNTACIYIENSLQESARLSYVELDKKARAVASHLQTSVSLGDRLLLMYPPGIDFIIAFIGCLYAGVIAVPVSVRLLQDDVEAVNNIARDANISGFLTSENYINEIKQKCAAFLSTRENFIIDTLNVKPTKEDKYKLPAINDETIAYLNYTTSSRVRPKGVVVRHKNLNHSLKYTAQIGRYCKKSITCNWLPHTETPGLLLGILVPLYTGSTTILLSSEVVKKNPLLWLQTISQYHVTHSGALNSGYDLCVNEIDLTELKKIKLKSWQVALNAGENLSHETLNAFAKKFLKYGFQSHRFTSVYTLAEAVGVVSVTTLNKVPSVFNLNTDAVKRNDVVITHKNIPHRKYIGNGHLLPGLDAVIMDNEKKLPLKEGKIGEIWLAGDSIVDEYWNTQQEEEERFGLSVPGVKGAFYKTGDVGFIKNGEMCVIGRLDEVITSDTKKYYPLDLEITAGIALHQLPVKPYSAIINVTIDDKPVVVFLQEVKTNQIDIMLNEIMGSIRRSLLQRHSLELYDVILVKENSLPKTQSGRVQRILCGKQYLENTLCVLASYRNKISTSKIADNSVSEITSTNIKKVLTPNLNGVAIIGINGVFPGANNINQFWENLLTCKNPITQIPPERWSWQDYFGESQVENYKSDVKWGGFINDISKFDARFFNISPREAELMDPQQRLFLQTTWSAIEDAGYIPENLAQVTTGVFVGASSHEYAELLHGVADVYAKTGLSHGMIANRVSRFFNLNGPSEVIDTGESSSLVALHHAVRAITAGDCEVAIVGGVNALLSPTAYLNQSKLGLLSHEGKACVFDKNADGYVRSEGVATIILKSLTKAHEDGDSIYGVIKGIAVNYEGKSNSVQDATASIEAVIKNASKQADISFDTISYVEMNADGRIGNDLAEINALKQVFIQQQSLPLYCGVGSVKSNIGHLEAASGMASLIKVLLAMKHQQLPANLHFNEIHPQIDLTHAPFYILDKARPWLRFVKNENEEIPLRAGISSFGLGGVNAHAIVEEYIPNSIREERTENHAHLITLSARTEDELGKRIGDLHDWLLVQHELPALSALSYTLNIGRQHFDIRCAIVVGSITHLQESLSALLNKQEPENVVLNMQGNKKTKWRPIFQTLFKQLMQDVVSTHSFTSDEYKNKLLAIGNFYTEGYEINWQDLYKTNHIRLNLPTYPFAKEHYWVPTQAEILEFTPDAQRSCVLS